MYSVDWIKQNNRVKINVGKLYIYIKILKGYLMPDFQGVLYKRKFLEKLNKICQ